MNINKVSFGQLKTKANSAYVQEVLSNYVESDKIKNEHQYKLIKEDETSFIDAQPKTEQEIYLLLLNRGVKVSKVTKPVSFGSLQVTLKNEEEKSTLKDILRNYDKLDAGLNPEYDREYKMFSKGNTKLIFATPSTEEDLKQELFEEGIDAKEVMAGSLKRSTPKTSSKETEEE